MPNNHSQVALNDQKTKVSGGSPKLKIIAPCTPGNGILKLKPTEEAYYQEQFYKISSPLCFFIPASGSGSRMFDFLQVELALGKPELAMKTNDFINRLQDFAFYKSLNEKQKEQIASCRSHKELIDFILTDEQNGIGLGNLPKGLIPFHSYGQQHNSAFHEHLSQGVSLSRNTVNFHFTIQYTHQEAFEQALSNFKSEHKQVFDAGFSFQDPETDAYVFDKQNEPLRTGENTYLRRPSGHGALLSNINRLEEQYLLVKNIDNVQHGSIADHGIKVWRVLCGILYKVKNELRAIHEHLDYKKLKSVSKQFDLFSAQEIEAAKDKAFLRQLVNRPLRICGMVLNEGKAGGGPFYVEHDGNISKQIVEGVQITGEEQQRIFNSSTHFNPVMMAMDTHDLDGNKIDLTKFSNDAQYFVVKKNFEGQEVTYIERPGLWNGAMFSWNTLFIEVPSNAFTPVKTVFDLLKPAHQQK